MWVVKQISDEMEINAIVVFPHADSNVSMNDVLHLSIYCHRRWEWGLNFGWEVVVLVCLVMVEVVEVEAFA